MGVSCRGQYVTRTGLPALRADQSTMKHKPRPFGRGSSKNQTDGHQQRWSTCAVEHTRFRKCRVGQYVLNVLVVESGLQLSRWAPKLLNGRRSPVVTMRQDPIQLVQATRSCDHILGRECSWCFDISKPLVRCARKYGQDHWSSDNTIRVLTMWLGRSTLTWKLFCVTATTKDCACVWQQPL